jgi:type IX secretion system PorP/SprF family membrane protein
MKKYLYILFFGVLIMNRANGQDPNYSQFFTSPLTINPAFAGNSDCKWEAMSTFRNQSIGLGTSFKTKTISLDGRIFEDENKQSYFGVGGLLMLDEAMDGLYKSSFLSLNTSCHITLDKYEGKNHSLTAGLGWVYNKTNIDYGGLTSSEQLSFSGFNRSLPMGEPTLKNIPGVSTANAGLMYSFISEEKMFDIGIAGYRFYKNNISVFENGTQFTTPRYNAHIDFAKFINYNLILYLKGYYQVQNGIANVTGGGHLEYSLTDQYDNEQKAIHFGAYYRVNDAIIPYFGIMYNQLQFGVSYDVQVSKVKSGSVSPNTFELSLIFKKRKKWWNPLY